MTLPLLKPSIQSALILRTVLAFEVFAVVYALSGRNFPVLVGEAYAWQHVNQNNGVAAAYAILVMLISLAATVIYIKALRRQAGDAAMNSASISPGLRRLVFWSGITALCAWIFVPIYLIALGAFGGRAGVFRWPKNLMPSDVSLSAMQTFLAVEGVWAAALNW